jgi:hypothetical protein
MELLIFVTPLYAALVIWSCIILIKSIFAKGSNPERPLPRFIFWFSAVLFTVPAPVLGFWRMDSYGAEIPFASRHVFSIYILVAVVVLAYWISVLVRQSAGPALRIFLSSVLVLGISFCVITTFHFAGHILLGMIFPLFGFELLSPFMAMLLLIKELVALNNYYPVQDHHLPLRHEVGFASISYSLFSQSVLHRLAAYLPLGLLVLAACGGAAWVAGSEPDALIRSFTNSTGFILSNR